MPPSGGYTGLENQLYRVEIHQRRCARHGDLQMVARQRIGRDARDRASSIRRPLVVESVGKDDVLRFNDGDWIEITDDWLELTGVPGQPDAPRAELHRITVGGGVDDATAHDHAR